LEDTAESVYFNKLSTMLLIRETLGATVERVINFLADFIVSSQNQLSFS
jgi:hypothetical protein